MKINLKPFLPVVLSAAVIFATAAVPAYATPSTSSQPQNTVTESSKSLFTSDGKLLGTVTKKTTVTIDKKGEEVLFSVTEDNDYQLQPEFANIKEYQEKFTDSIDTDSYEITKDKKVYRNGKLVDNNKKNVNLGISPLGAEGGIPAFSHYYSTDDYSFYYFASYDDINFGGTNGYATPDVWASPDGNHVSRSYVYPTNTHFYGAKSAVDSFEDDYNDFIMNMYNFQLASGLMLIGLVDLIGFIPGAGAAAFAAAQAYDSFQDTEDSIKEAYDYISLL